MKIQNLILPVLLIFLVLIPCSLYGQSYYLVGGINFSNLGQVKENLSVPPKRIYTPGFQIGSSVDIKLNNHLSLMPGLLFSLKREKYKSSVYFPAEMLGDPNSEEIILLHFSSSRDEYYIDIPIVLKMKFTVGDLDFYGLSGPYLSYLLSENFTMNVLENGNKFDFPISPLERVTKIDYGIKVGMGIDLNKYLIQLSYDHGLFREIRSKLDDYEMVQIKRNATARLSLGYKLGKTSP